MAGTMPTFSDDRPSVPIVAGCIHGLRVMGALTPISGNAPNFMVKAIAEQRRTDAPSFFGYMAWSVILLLPLVWACIR